MDVKIEPSWKQALEAEFTKPYFVELAEFIKREYKSAQIFPPPAFIFHAFAMTPFNQVKVVILGQDPYHNDGQANGLAFAVPATVDIPPSLVNIYKEIAHDTGKTPERTGNLDRWAKQGVLLLNATLTVRAHQAGSHQNKGWEQFTDAAIKALSEKRENLVFLLWGNYAQKKGSVINAQKHLILKAPHPSPLSAHTGFLGCGHFSQTNTYLMLNGEDPINW